MLYREIIAVYCENLTKHTYTVWEKCKGFKMLKQVVPISTAGYQFTSLHSDPYRHHTCYRLAVTVYVLSGRPSRLTYTNTATIVCSVP
jgi:hypothetical protein